MQGKVDVTTAVGPIRVRVSSNEPTKLRIAEAPVGVRVLGMPGPRGPEGPRGPQGTPGVTILPTDAPINGGFF